MLKKGVESKKLDVLQVGNSLSNSAGDMHYIFSPLALIGAEIIRGGGVQHITPPSLHPTDECPERGPTVKG